MSSHPRSPFDPPQPLPHKAERRHKRLWAGGLVLGAAMLSVGITDLLRHPQSPLPGLTSPAMHTTPAAAQLAMLPPREAAAALKDSQFTTDEQATILAAVKRGEMRLVRMPLLDASGVTGQMLDVASAGLTQRIVLTGSFQSLVLPISEVGTVTLAPVTPPRPPALTVGILTALGPELMPNLAALDQRILLHVIVQ